MTSKIARLSRILVIDDEPQILRFLRTALAAQDYEVLEAADAATGLKLALSAAPDAILLDLGLPDGDGKELIASIRQGSDTPIIVLSARAREAEKIAAFDLGADDYVNKPFGIGELLARLRAALRHRAKAAGETAVYSRDGLSVDTTRRLVRRGDAVVHLTPKEYELLRLLVAHAGKVLTHRQLLTQVWGPAHGDDTAALRVFIAQLRRKIEPDPDRPSLIRTEPGVGYRLNDE